MTHSQTIFIKGLQVLASIGVHPHEYEKRQTVIIDLEIDMGAMALPVDDRLGETLDYAEIARGAEEIALEAHVQLVETLAARIARWVLSLDSRAQSVKILISKPQALLKADSAGSELILRR